MLDVPRRAMPRVTRTRLTPVRLGFGAFISSIRPVGLSAGRRSHWRAARTRSANRASSLSCAPIRRRFVVWSRSTIAGTVSKGSHPRRRATRIASRVFTSSPPSRSCKSATTVLSSITSTVLEAGWNASASIRPRSPYSLKLTSTATSQPRRSRYRTIRSPRAAWRSSRSWAISARRYPASHPSRMPRVAQGAEPSGRWCARRRRARARSPTWRSGRLSARGRAGANPGAGEAAGSPSPAPHRQHDRD